MNKVLVCVLVFVALAVASAVEHEYTPTIVDPSAEEMVESLGLMDETDAAPSMSMDDLPMFSYLENANTVEADHSLDEEIAHGANLDDEDEHVSLLETDADMDMDEEMDMDEDYPENANIPLTAPKSAHQIANEKLMEIPSEITVSGANTVPFKGYVEVKIPEISRNDTVKPKIIPLAAVAGIPKDLEANLNFSPADAIATVHFQLDCNRHDYWRDPANFKWQLLQDIAQVVKVNSQRVKIVNIDPQTMDVTFKILQAYAADMVSAKAAHAEALARAFYNFHVLKNYSGFKLLSKVNAKVPVKYAVEQVPMPILAGIRAQIMIGADVRAVSANVASYLKGLASDIAKVAGVKDTQVVITYAVPYGGVSLHSFLVEFKFISRPDTLADKEVNPMTALSSFKKAMDNKDSLLYKLGSLKDIDTTFPLQRNLNDAPLRPYTSWVEDPLQYQPAPLYEAQPDMTHKPIVIPTLLVGAPVNQTVAYPDHVAIPV